MDTRCRYHRDTCCGIKVVKITYTFAIFNLVVVLLMWFGCIVTQGYLVTTLLVAWTEDNMSILKHPTWIVCYIVHAVVCVVTSASGVFAVLLLQGIRKKKPKLVLAYLYFGRAMAAVMLLGTAVFATVIMIAAVRGRADSIFVYRIPCIGLVLALCICMFYCLILSLVRMTHNVLLERTRNTFDTNALLHVYEEEPWLNHDTSRINGILQ